MPSSMPNANNFASSPPSGGTNTHHGTPSTIPTMMSPEGGNICAETAAGTPRAFLAAPGNASASLAARRAQAVNYINTTGMVPCGPAPPSRRSSRPHFGVFTLEDVTTRGFMVAGINPATPGLYEIVANCFSNYPSLIGVDATLLRTEGSFTVEFFDFKDAYEALSMTNNTIFFGQHHQCFKLLPKSTAAQHRIDPETVSDHVGEYLISVIDVGAATFPIDAEAIIYVCEHAVGPDFRAVKAVQAVQRLPGAVATWRVEYYDSRVNAMRISGATFQGYCLTIMPFTPDVESLAMVPSFREREQVQVRYTSNYQPLMTPEYLPNYFPRIPAASPHNVVDLNRIRHGQDVRTTLMLRNIPNRVDQAGLEQYLNASSLGQYDFMYLRIDFANNCNVGYAFINFIDPMAIVAFAQMRAGRKWNVFQSEKVAEISYATIQGRDCLIQKFRNSSVMLEQPAFRPKLYFTYGPRAGQEEPFPKADNHAKLRRSCDNAEHVGLYHPVTSSALTPARGAFYHVAPPRNQLAGGVYTIPARSREASRYASPDRLFAPREGSAYRERQRRHDSTYDRGTPGAEFERHTSIKRERSESTQPLNRSCPAYPLGDQNYYNNLQQNSRYSR